MNQARSTYKTDFVPYDWMQNNFASNTEDFCSSENVDDCLRYISREFSALGYPSVYTNENAIAFPVNCDIVKLLNVTYELLGNCREHAQSKEDFECRNRSLLEDFKMVNRKNCHLKESLEQAERKYKGALEKERQSKEKNKDLAQLLKIEKDESKRLTSQIQQQKKTYQHEIRKAEHNMTQMKARLNHLLADKNPSKKVASITSPNILQRDSNQRGKWKTGSVAHSNFEEMYKSVISSYETRCQELLKEISTFHSCFEFIQSQMLETIFLLKIEGNERDKWSSDLTPLQAVWNETSLQKTLEERFMYLIGKMKDVAFQRNSYSAKKCDMEIHSKVSECIVAGQDFELPEQANGCERVFQESDQNRLNSWLSAEELETEREKLKKEKAELSVIISLIEKEKADLEVRKLELIKMALQQEVPKAQWHQNLNTVPSFSVIHTSGSVTAVPCDKQLKNCISAPDQQIQSLAPLWGSEVPKKNIGDPIPKSVPLTLPNFSPPIDTQAEVGKETECEESSLPKWAITAIKSSPLCTDAQSSETEASILNSFSNEDINLSTVSSTEEQNLALLNSAMEDIESRRKQVSL